MLRRFLPLPDACLPAPSEVYSGYAAGVAAKSANAKEAADFVRYLTD